MATIPPVQPQLYCSPDDPALDIARTAIGVAQSGNLSFALDMISEAQKSYPNSQLLQLTTARFIQGIIPTIQVNALQAQYRQVALLVEREAPPTVEASLATRVSAYYTRKAEGAIPAPITSTPIPTDAACSNSPFNFLPLKQPEHVATLVELGKILALAKSLAHAKQDKALCQKELKNELQSLLAKPLSDHSRESILAIETLIEIGHDIHSKTLVSDVEAVRPFVRSYMQKQRERHQHD